MLCGTMSASNEAKPLSGKTGKLTDNVACAIHMSDPKEEPKMGTFKTVRHTVDPSSGKKKDVVGTSFTSDFGPGSEHTDLELVMPSGTPMSDQSIAFKPCEDFDIIGTISDDRGVYFTKKIKVQQTCPKPAALDLDSEGRAPVSARERELRADHQGLATHGRRGSWRGALDRVDG